MVVVVWSAVGFLDPLLPPWGGHFGTHFGVGLGGGIVGFGALRSRDVGASGPRRAAARIVIAGAFIVALAGLVEAQSAWIEYPSMGTLHDLSGLAWVLGMFVFAVGLALPVAAGRLPRWVLALAVVAAALLWFTTVFGVNPFQ